MTWTYSEDPSATPKDAVRFFMQDIQKARPLLSDEDIEYLLGRYYEMFSQSPVYVAAIGCEIIAARYAHEVSVSADGVSVGVSELQDKYLKLAVQLRDLYEASQSSGEEFASFLDSSQWDWSIPPFVFGMGLHDNALAGRQDYGGWTHADWQRAWSGTPEGSEP